MRIVAYNILDGGHGRADPLAEVLLFLTPDVVVLTEADDPAILERIGWRLGFDCVSGEGPEGRVAAVLTRGTMTRAVNHALLRDGAPRSLLEAHVEVDGVGLTIFAVHLHAGQTPADEQRRAAEVGVLLDVASAVADLPHVLAGDFNALLPDFRVDRARLKPSAAAVFDELGDLPRSALRPLTEAGYADLIGPDAPATFTTRHPGLRVDHLLGRFTSAGGGGVCTDRLAFYASDHLPVWADVTPTR